MNRRKKTIIICGAIVLLVTIVVALCIQDWNGVVPYAIFAIFWAEVVFFGGLIYVDYISERTEQLMAEVSFTQLLTIYSLVTIIISVVFILALRESKVAFLIIQMLLLAALTILLVIIYTVSKTVKLNNNHVLKATSSIDRIIERLHKLLLLDRHRIYEAKLRKLINDMEFTDKSIVVASDDEMEKVISDLEIELKKTDNEMSDEKINECLTTLDYLISERRLSIATVKKGRI